MNEKLRAYVEKLFETAPHTQRVTELKEELLSGLDDKYNDLIANQYSEEEAYRRAVSGIGNINDLLRELQYDPLEEERMRKKSKKLRNSIISMVWTLTLILYFVVSFTFGNWYISWIIFIVAALISQIIKLGFDLKGS